MTRLLLIYVSGCSFLASGSHRRTAVALKFTLHLKVVWQGERERSTWDILIMASEDLKGVWTNTLIICVTITQTVKCTFEIRLGEDLDQY